MAYYGDPDTLIAGLQAIKSLEDHTVALAAIAKINGFVTPWIEGHLRAVYTVWPPAADTDANAISTLWHCKMLEFLYRFRFAQNAVAVPSELAEWAKAMADQTLADMKCGKIIVLGAYQAGAVPQISAGIPQFAYQPDPIVQKTIMELFTRGLRV